MEGLDSATYEQYIPESESNDEYDTDSDDSDRPVHSHNIGYHNVTFNRDETFINDTKTIDYEKSRDALFTPALRYDNIIVDSRNHTNDVDTNRSSYTVKFEDDTATTNNTEGYGIFKNVIGFKLIKANIPSRVYNVDTHNNVLMFTFDSTEYTITLDSNSYTGTTLAAHIASKMNAESGVSSVSVAFDTTTNLFTFNHSSTNLILRFGDHVRENMINHILGFDNSNTSAAISITGTKPALFETHYVDLVIPEIPYIACKKNAFGKHLIDRIPINATAGTMSDYFNAANSDKDSYFYPFDLHKITIQLYDESNHGLYTSKGDNYFEFEVTMMNNVKLL